MNCINEQTDMYKAKLSKHAQVLAEICAFALRFLLNILNREAENRLDNHSIINRNIDHKTDWKITMSTSNYP